MKAGDLTLAASDYTAAYSNENPTDAGSYKVTVTGKGNYVGSVSSAFAIEKAANTMTLKGKKVSAKQTLLKKKAKTYKRSKAITVKNAKGNLSFKRSKITCKKSLRNQAKKKIKISNSGKLTLKKGLKKGTYKLKVEVAAAGDANYKAASKTVTVKIKVK